MSKSTNNTIDIKGNENVNVNLQDVNYSNVHVSIGKKDDELNLLTVFVLTSTKMDFIKKLTDRKLFSSIIQEKYAELLRNWKPYANQEAIDALLTEFADESGFKINVYFLQEEIITDQELAVHIEDGELENHILIIDPLAIHLGAHKQFASVLDKSPLGAVLVPFCQTVPQESQTPILKNLAETMPRLYRHFFTRYSRAYVHLELCIPTKKLLFRRLSNIAIEKLKKHPKKTNKLEEKFKQRMKKFNIPDTKDIN